MYEIIYTKGECAPEIFFFESELEAIKYIDQILCKTTEEWYKTTRKKYIEWVYDKRRWVYYLPDSEIGYYENPEMYEKIEMKW